MSEYADWSDAKKNAFFTCKYAYWLSNFQSKFYLRANASCCFIQLLLGSIVFTSIVSAGWLALLIGFLVAALAAIQFAASFGQNAEKASVAMSAFQKLEFQFSDGTADAELSKRLNELQTSVGIPSLSGMEVLAYNRTCDWLNFSVEKMPTTCSSRFFALFL